MKGRRRITSLTALAQCGGTGVIVRRHFRGFETMLMVMRMETDGSDQTLQRGLEGRTGGGVSPK